jgi:hypothetical protein
MSLPIFQTASKDLSLLQTNWAQQLNPVIQLPINSGSILQNVVLSSGLNVVNHKLGRKLQGWFIVRQNAAGSFYDSQDINPYPDLTLFLNSSATVTVHLFVF